MIVIVYEAECKVICCQHYTSIHQLFTEVEMNKIVLVYTRKWSEIYLLTHDRVSPVARRLIVLAYVVCVNENYFAL